MARFVKQIIYGIFFVAVGGLVVAAISGAFSAKTLPACTNDCRPAGPTIAEVGEPLVMKTANDSFLAVLVEVRNSSTDYGVANLHYTIGLNDQTGRTLATLSQADDVLPGEDKYLLAVSNDGTIIPDVASASFNVGMPNWQSALAFPLQPVSLTAGPTVTVGSSSITVAGTVRNGGSGAVAGLKALVVVFDKYQDPLFAGETVVSVPPFGETGFSIDLPANLQNLSLFDPGRTRVYLYQ